MKKILAALLACALALGLMAFVGCSSEGTISGNYKEVTSDEDWEKVAKALNSETIAGDTAAENWSFGFGAKADFELSMSDGEEKFNLNTDFDYSLSLAENSFNGAGSVNFSMITPEGTEVPSTEASGSVYNDEQYIYFNGSMKSGETTAESKIKIDYSAILGALGGEPYNTFALQNDTGISGGITGVVLKNLCQTYHLSLSADFSSGTKIKLSATDEFFNSIANEITGDTQTEKQPVVFSKTIIDFYLYIDENGTFAQAAANIDFGMSAEIPATDGQKAQKTELSAKGTLSVKVKTEGVSLPDDLNSYTEMPLA